MKRSQYIHYLVLLIFIIVAYWQVSLLKHPILWDATDLGYPWQYFISECLRNGHLPLWNPYVHCGYPFFADPNSNAFYPVTLIICLLGKFTIYTMDIEFILIIFAGAMGMYRLLCAFAATSAAALFGAICFAACGFCVGNAEHISWLTSASCILWLLWAYCRMLQTGKYGYAMLCAAFFFFLLSGGYIAFTIVMCYVLAALFIAGMVTANGREARIRLINNNAVFAVLFLLLGGACIFSYSEVAHYMTRGNGITLQKANSLPFSPQCSLSFLLPFASIKNDALYLTDISMRNAYFGIFGLILMITALVTTKDRKQWAVIAASFLCLLISFGPYLPLRKWLYEYVPLMRLFRFPALFRIFFLIGFILIASMTFQRVLAAPKNYLSWLKAVTVVVILAIVVPLCYELHKYGLAGDYKMMFHNISQFLAHSLFYQHIVVQSIIQLLLLLVFLGILYFRNARYLNTVTVLLLCAADLVIATQLNMYGTVTDTLSCTEINNKTTFMPEGFPVPGNHNPMAVHNDFMYHEQMKPIVNNLSIFMKDVAIDGYNPFMLNNYNTLCDNPIKDSVWANPYLYFAYSVVPITGTGSLPSRHTAAVTGDVYSNLRKQVFAAGDSDKVEVLTFEPGNITATAHLLHTAILVLQQSDYPGWRVLVDGRETAHFTSAYSNISLVLQPGVHNVAFRFAPKIPFVFFVLSMLVFAIMVLSLAIFRRKLL